MKKWLIGTALMAAISVSAFAAPKEIAVIVKSNSSTYWQNVNKGSTASAKEFAKNYNVTFQGPDAESNIVEQVNMVQNAINRHVAAIVLAPSDPKALIPAVKQAHENGIPVIIIDSALDDSGKQYYQCFLATDNFKAGQEAAKELLARVKNKEGKLAVISYVQGVGSEIARVGGFMDVIKKQSKLQLVGTYYCDSDMSKALNQTTDVLSAHPDLTAIWGANEPSAIGMGRAVKQLGFAGKLTAIGFDGNTDLQGFVRDGTLQGIVVQSSYKMGFESIKIAVDILNGKKVPATVDTGALFVDKANIDSTAAKNVLY